MNQAATKDPTYVLGRSDIETMRLAQQAALFEPTMRRLLTEAGITPGMSVLDLGSGTGDVAMLAAEMVGPTGRVPGVDSNPAIVSAAQARVQAAGLSHVASPPLISAICTSDRHSMHADTLISAGSEQMQRFAPYVANLLRRLMPKLVEYGIATEEEVAIDTFEERYVNEVLTERMVVQWWPCVGAWARR